MARGRIIKKVVELEECSLETASNEFFRHNKVKGLSEATQKIYIGYITRFVEWCGKDTPTSEINSKILDDYVLQKEEDGNKPVSIATTMKHIKRFINFCEKRDYVSKIEITIPKFEVELKEPYSDDEMKLLLARPVVNKWVEWRNWCMVNYFYSTGQRLSTVINIKLKHLDLENNRVLLKWNKDKIQKYMPLSTAIVKVLKEYIELSGLEDEDYLFPEYEGKQLKAKSAQDTIAEYNRKRGVTKTSIHLFRHTFSRQYIMNGGNPMKLQKLLAHKTLDMTMRYVNLYGNDVGSDLDIYNPLDNFKRNNHIPTKRLTVAR